MQQEAVAKRAGNGGGAMNDFYDFLTVATFAMCLVTVFDVAILRRTLVRLLEEMAKLEEKK